MHLFSRRVKKDLLIQSLIYTINSYQRATTTLVVFYCGFNLLGRGARASSESQGWVGKGGWCAAGEAEETAERTIDQRPPGRSLVSGELDI